MSRQTSVSRSSSDSADKVNFVGQPLLRITAYFDQIPNRELVRAELAEALRLYELPSSSITDMSLREVADEDWLGEWKKNWQPVTTGRFIVAPPWSEVPEVSGQIVIRIEPGMAFGTGTHETTRLCLSAIEKHFSGGSLLDVGTGTGVLAIAAAKFSPDAKIEACDTDADAVAIARENARLNGVAEKIAFRVGTVEDDDGFREHGLRESYCGRNSGAAASAPRRKLRPTRSFGNSGFASRSCERHACANVASLPDQDLNDGEWVAIVV